MYRVFFNIGSKPIPAYGVMLAVGFIVATIVGMYRFREQYRDPNIVLDFVLAAVIGGILGARLFYVLGHWSYFAKNPREIFTGNLQGLVFYGGLILGLGLTMIVGKWRKQRFWNTLDLAGLCVPIALAIGRIGCLLNGCCYGKITSLPWGIRYPTYVQKTHQLVNIAGRRHPTQIYELILDVVLFGLLWWSRDSFEREGTTFWLFVMGYGAIRFFVEFFRDHGKATNAALMFQLMSVGFFVVAGVVLLFRYRLLPAARSGPELLY